MTTDLEELPKRKYQAIFDQLVAKIPSGRSVTIRVKNEKEIKKIKKAVYKEKNEFNRRDATPCTCSMCNGLGAPINKKYRLVCTIEDTLMTFKLVLNQSSIHNL